MKILLLSIGSRGDIEPFMAIGNVLQQNGIEVHCAFPAQFETEANDAGIPFNPLSERFLELLQSETGKAFMGQTGNVFHRLKQLRQLFKEMNSIQTEILQQQHDIIKELQPDKILFHPKCIYPFLWGQKHRNKIALIVPIPGVLHPIERHPPILPTTKDYGRTINRLVYRLADFARGRVLPRMLQPFVSGYPDADVSAKGLIRFMDQHVPAWYTTSPSLFPRPVDWPDHAKVIGYFERNKTRNWEPSSELQQFVDQHQKILFASFGSMTNPDPVGKTNAILAVTQQLNIPLIINTYSGGLVAPDPLPDNVFVVESIPYEWIFPRVYAVMHHGGSGTTHTAIKHGCANLIIPHIVDQYFWNHTVSQLGAGPAGVPIKKLNERTLLPLLTDLWNDPEYRTTAQRIAAQMAGEGREEDLLNLVLQK